MRVKFKENLYFFSEVSLKPRTGLTLTMFGNPSNTLDISTFYAIEIFHELCNTGYVDLGKYSVSEEDMKWSTKEY